MKILDQRLNHPSTYTNIYLAFHLFIPHGDNYQIEALSSNLISGHEVISIASNLFYKYTMNDTDASIQTRLIYKTTGNSTSQQSLGDLLNLLSTTSCALKFLPTSLILDIFVYYLLFFYITIFMISERKDSFLSLLNISGLQ